MNRKQHQHVTPPQNQNQHFQNNHSHHESEPVHDTALDLYRKMGEEEFNRQCVAPEKLVNRTEEDKEEIKEKEEEKDSQEELSSKVQLSGVGGDDEEDEIHGKASGIYGKMSVSSPDDESEIEADRTAERVMSSTAEVSKSDSEDELKPKEIYKPMDTKTLYRKIQNGEIKFGGAPGNNSHSNFNQEPVDKNSLHYKLMNGEIRFGGKPGNNSGSNFYQETVDTNSLHYKLMNGEIRFGGQPGNNSGRNFYQESVDKNSLHYKLMNGEIRFGGKPGKNSGSNFYQEYVDTNSLHYKVMNGEIKFGSKINKKQAANKDGKNVFFNDNISWKAKGGEAIIGPYATNNRSKSISNNLSTKINSKRGTGSSLPDDTRNFMEPRLGADFSGVKIHNDSDSHAISKSLNAKAFAVGSDVFFAQGQYNPHSYEGKKLMAHELAHVAQGGELISRKKKDDKERPFYYGNIDYEPVKKEVDNRTDREIFLEWRDQWVKMEKLTIANEKRIREELRNRDKVDFADKYTDFSHGAYDVLGPDYKEAYELKQFVTNLLGHQEKVLNWIEDRMVKGNHPTANEIDSMAFKIVENEENFATYIAPWIYSGLAAIGNVPGTRKGHQFFSRIRVRINELWEKTITKIRKTETPITKNSVIENYKISNHAWRKSGLGRGATEELVRSIIRGGQKKGSVNIEVGSGKFQGNIIKEYSYKNIKVIVDDTRKIIMSIRPLKGFKLK